MKFKMRKEKINKSKVYTSLVALCWFTIVACNILKLLGYREFEIPLFDFEINIWLERIINSTFFALNTICFGLILIKRKPKFKELLLMIVLGYFNYTISFFIPDYLYIVLDLAIYFLIGMITIKHKWYRILLECVLISLIFIVYQLLTMLYKNINIKFIVEDFISDKILQIDYYMLIILTILHEFKKGDFIHGRWWQNFLVLLSKQKRFKKNVRQNKQVVEKVENELAYKIFIVVLSISQFVIVGTACYFVNQVIIEFLIVFISFVFMRATFGKSYHCDSVIKCTSLSIATFVLATRLTLPSWASMLCNVLIGCLVAYMMYVMYYYIKYTKEDGITITKGMNKEDLIKLCDLHNIQGVDRRILIEYYVERKRLNNIAIKLNYSVDSIKAHKGRILKQINS